MSDIFLRSSLTDERDIEEFARRSGQVECRHTHGIVTSSDYAMPLFWDHGCPMCGAQV